MIVLDRGLPAIEGLDLLGRLRARGVAVPVLVLSALGLARDRVDGLDAGAEDYLAKPFDIDELLARIRALLRRHGDVTDTLPGPGRTAGGVRPDRGRTPPARPSTSRSASARCSPCWPVGRSRVFSRAELMAEVFPDAEDDGVVDTYVHYLRRKLGRDTVRTVRGLGYQLGAGTA